MAPNKPFQFLDLCPELRNAVYSYAIDWPHLSDAFDKIQTFQEQKQEQEREESNLILCTITSTPSLLLLDRTTSLEAHGILYQKPFILSSPPPYVPQSATPMEITGFIRETTLQNLKFVVLEMDLGYESGIGKCWLKTVETLLDIWCERNALERLVVRARYVPPDRSAGWTFKEAAHHGRVMGVLSRVGLGFFAVWLR